MRGMTCQLTAALYDMIFNHACHFNVVYAPMVWTYLLVHIVTFHGVRHPIKPAVLPQPTSHLNMSDWFFGCTAANQI